MKRFYWLLLFLSFFTQDSNAQDQTEVSITRTWPDFSNTSNIFISKNYKITKDSVFINITGDPHLSMLAFKLEESDSLYIELLNTPIEKWENIAQLGKACLNCDTCIGVKVTVQKKSLIKDYWIRCIGAGYPENIRTFVDKIFMRIKE